MINVTENIKKFLEEPTRDKKILKVLKNDHRSYVYMFELDNKKYVYKEPKEKNNRKWQKFLNFFRGSESKRGFFQMKKINMLGLKTATPIYFEKEFLSSSILKPKLSSRYINSNISPNLPYLFF